MSLEHLSSFYTERPDGAFDASPATAGPWGPDLQHAGPPAALAVRELEREPGPPIARVTVDILRPIPVAPVAIATRVLRPGKRISLVEASVSLADGAWAALTARA